MPRLSQKELINFTIQEGLFDFFRSRKKKEAQDLATRKELQDLQARKQGMTHAAQRATQVQQAHDAKMAAAAPAAEEPAAEVPVEPAPAAAATPAATPATTTPGSIRMPAGAAKEGELVGYDRDGDGVVSPEEKGSPTQQTYIDPTTGKPTPYAGGQSVQEIQAPAPTATQAPVAAPAPPAAAAAAPGPEPVIPPSEPVLTDDPELAAQHAKEISGRLFGQQTPAEAQPAAAQPTLPPEVQAKIDAAPQGYNIETGEKNPAAGARGKKGARGPKSETESAIRKRIARAEAAGRPVSQEDLAMLQKAGVKGKQKVGGAKVSNLRRRKNLADSFSQKELLAYTSLYSEGFGTAMRGALGKTAQVAGGLAGVAGQTLLPKTKQLKDTLIGSFKTGARAEAERQAKGGVLGLTGDMFKGRLAKLKKALEDQGYMYKDHSGDLNKQVSVEVGEIKYVDGKPELRPSERKLQPVIAKWDAGRGTYTISRVGRRGTTPGDGGALPYWHYAAQSKEGGGHATDQSVQPGLKAQ